jgi:hypothetical protein
MNAAILKSFSARVVDWLSDSEIRSEQGAVYSWLNPDKPGYVYNEVIGYYIRLFSYLYRKTGDEEYLHRAIVSADYLSNNLSECGGVSRGDIDYVFDSAICASGLIALGKVGTLKREHRVALERLIGFVYKSLTKKQVAFKRGQAINDVDKWSLSYGSFLIKNCIALYEAYESFNDEKYREMAERLANGITKETFKNGCFTINGQRHHVYTHPHCYATEGLLFMITKGYDFDRTVFESAAWLAKNQNDDGSMNNWYCVEGVELHKQGDATAQATRIWLCVDKKKFRENIRRATLFLKSLQSKEGGLVYNKGQDGGLSKDINSWVSMFAVQALLWQIEEPERSWIV